MIMPVKKISRLPLYRAGDFYSICIWESIFRQRIAGRENQSLIISRILALKKSGKYGNFFKSIISAAFMHFNCESLAVVPPSKKGFGSLQKIMENRTFERTRTIPPRKYRHEGLTGAYGRSIKVSREDLEGRVLLVDDVITTGGTMRYFKTILKGYDTVMFAFALNWKLKPRVVGELEIERPEEERYSSADLIDIEIPELDMADFDLPEL